MAKPAAPEIRTVTAAELEQLLSELRGLLPAATYELVAALLHTLQWIMGILGEKKASLRRLRRLIFGAQTEKASHVLPATAEEPKSESSSSQPESKPPGHGRNGADAYPGAPRVKVPHRQLRRGQLCPKCLKGTLYLLKVPALIIRIVAQPLFTATVDELEKLRCTACGAVFTAAAPTEAGLSKHDPSVGIMLALMRYGSGLPMYRMAKWQQYFGVPLPATTQWQLIAAGAAEGPRQIYEELRRVAAQGEILHNDDTSMRVQSLRRKTEAEPPERTGVFTSSIVARVGSTPVALFFTGSQHAGENLDQLLQHRAPEQPPPLQMCDALSRNEPETFKTIVANCLLHARRQFVEIVDDFPDECRHVIESLREVYRIEALAKAQPLTAAQRLTWHQEKSQPVMDELQQWMREQRDQKRVEPNSGLGQAITYMLKRWERLTRFLTVPGAPLDNNLVERALKTAVLHRKNSLSYKTLRGAEVGDIFMSLIETCALNRVNPFDYLMALGQHSAQVAKDPAAWLPWNYPRTVETAGSG